MAGPQLTIPNEEENSSCSFSPGALSIGNLRVTLPLYPFVLHSQEERVDKVEEPQGASMREIWARTIPSPLTGVLGCLDSV